MKLGRTEFRKIDYLEWARLHMGRVKFDLACSNIQPLTPADLGLSGPPEAFSSPGAEDYPPLVDLIAARYGVERSRIMITNGASGGLYLVYMALLRHGDEILLESPNYEPLYRMATHLEVVVKVLERSMESRFQIDLEEVQRKIGKSTRAIVLTNLHNPSGVALDPERLRTMGQIARAHDALVIASEVYLDNAFDEKHRPICTYGENLVSINSLTKVYGLGGIRIGWVIAPEAVIARMRIVADYVLGGVSLPSAQIALAAMRQAGDLLGRSRRIVQQNLKTLEDWTAKRPGVQWVKPDGGTIAMLRLPGNMPSQDLSRVLREKYSTLVVPGEFFWTKGVIRVSLGGDPAVFVQGLANIGRAMDEWTKSWR